MPEPSLRRTFLFSCKVHSRFPETQVETLISGRLYLNCLQLLRTGAGRISVFHGPESSSQKGAHPMKKNLCSFLTLALSFFLMFTDSSAVFAASSADNAQTVTQTQTSSKSLSCKKAAKTQTVSVSSKTVSIQGTDSLNKGNITGAYSGTKKTVVKDHYVKGKTSKTRKTTITTVKNYTMELSSSARKKVLSQIAPGLARAWEALGFSFAIVPALGCRSCRCLIKERKIQLGTGFELEDIYHMMGYFLSFAAGNVSSTTAFRQIYEMEKYLYGGVYKGSALKSPQEFFAVCMREYCLRPQKLMKECTQTFHYIQAAIGRLTDRQISLCKALLNSASK